VSTETEHLFPEDHPTAAGHFPGNPVIPGATLLDVITTAITAADGGTVGPCRISSAKFLHPVRPGDRMVIRWQASPAGDARFTCTVDDRPVLNGSLAR
jgi:3-hydroxymyristoyl/3-hydroxydecanoyl-(acyl carrier protein) dehydratase